MKLDETVLRAYVDGELGPARREQIEAVLAHNPELQALADALRASCLPYRAAYESQTLPPVPQRLADQVSVWSTLAASAPVAPVKTGRQRRSAVLGMGMGLAASFTAGLLLPWRPFDATPAAPARAAPWVAAIVGYHAMYVRATVDAQAERPDRALQLLSGFVPAQQARLRVPDLSSAGLSFRRVQRLGFEGAPLLQIVYLPAEGLPAALCVLPVPDADTPVRTRTLQGLSAADWTDRGLAFVLVADMPLSAADQLAAGIRRGDFKPA